MTIIGDMMMMIMMISMANVGNGATDYDSDDKMLYHLVAKF